MNLRTAALLLFYLLTILAMIPVVLAAAVFRFREPLVGIGRWAMRVSRAILGIRIETDGLESIDRTRPAVYMANHTSLLDGPLLFMIVPGSARVIMKTSVFRIPVAGFGMKYVGFVPVDRKGTNAGRASIERAARLMREKGYSFLIFPEGTRSRDGRLQAFRRGGFFLAHAAGSPIVPVTIRGTFDIMPKGRTAPRRGVVRVRFHPPVAVEGRDARDLGPLMEEVRTRIASGLD